MSSEDHEEDQNNSSSEDEGEDQLQPQMDDWEGDSDDSQEKQNTRTKKRKGEKDAPKGHAPVRKPTNGKLDYKSIIILSFLKVIKKIKTFTIRKLMRDIKEVENPTKPNYKPKKTLEVMTEQCEELKKIKNPHLKILIPFLIQYEFKESLDKYWPVLRAENVTKECEYNGLLKVALTELQQRDLSLDEDAFSRASTEVDSQTHGSGTRLCLS